MYLDKQFVVILVLIDVMLTFIFLFFSGKIFESGWTSLVPEIRDITTSFVKYSQTLNCCISIMNSILNKLWQHCPITIPNNSNQIQIDYSFKFHRPPKKTWKCFQRSNPIVSYLYEVWSPRGIHASSIQRRSSSHTAWPAVVPVCTWGDTTNRIEYALECAHAYRKWRKRLGAVFFRWPNLSGPILDSH